MSSIAFTVLMFQFMPKAQEGTTTRVYTTEDRVYDYIKRSNPKLEDSVASRLSESIVRESNKHDIPLNLILGLIKTESHFDQYAISKAGAMGFWQVLPRAHHDKILKQSNKNLYDPEPNSSLGAQILKNCLNKYRSLESGLACYNGSNRDNSQTYAKKVLRASKISI